MKKLVSTLFVILILLLTSFPLDTRGIAQNQNNIIYVDDDNTHGPWDGSQKHPYQFIQDAVHMANSGDTVFIFNGVYTKKIVNPLTQFNVNVFIQKPINLIGEDKEHTIIDGLNDGTVIDVFFTNNIYFSGFTIRNSTLYSPVYLDYGIGFFSNSYHKFENISIYNCKISDCGRGIGYFIHDSNIKNISICKCDIHNNSDDSIYLAVHGRNEMDNIRITDCSIRDNGVIGGSCTSFGGIHLGFSKNSYCSNILIKNCSIINNIAHGISLQGNNSKEVIRNVSIINNKIVNNYIYGIWISGKYDNFSIQSNIIKKNLIGVSIISATVITLFDNIICDNKKTGIHLQQSENILIKNNNCSFNKNDGIFCTHHSKNIVIDENRISSNGGTGIYNSYNSSRITITNNVISHSLEYGILMVCNNTMNVVENNTIKKCLRNGLYLKEVENITINNNYILDFNTSAIIFKESCYNNNILHNTLCNCSEGIQLICSDRNSVKFNNLINGTGLALLESSFNQIECNKFKNTNRGVSLYSSHNNIIEANSFENGYIGVNIEYSNSKNNIIIYNSFINNRNMVCFNIQCDKISEFPKNYFSFNYWGKNRIFPCLLKGNLEYNNHIFKWYYIDWHPAQEPYEI